MSSTPSPLAALKPLAGRALEAALNRLLALDTDTRAALHKLDGRRVELQVEAPPLSLSITVDGDQLRVGPSDSSSEPDLGVRATLGGLLSQLPFARGGGAPVGKLRINGDAELARTLQKLASGFDPDWDKPFADAFGVVIGPQVSRALREGLRGSGKLARGLARDAAEFVTEESRDVLSGAELAAFHDDVDDLRDRAERIIARASRLPGFDGGDGGTGRA